MIFLNFFLRFYVIQLLKYSVDKPAKKTLRRSKRSSGKNSRQFLVLNRWGRVGEFGKYKLDNFENLEDAKVPPKYILPKKNFIFFTNFFIFII